VILSGCVESATMPTRLWRAFALAAAVFALVFVVLDAVHVELVTDDPIATADAHPNGQLRVTGVTGTMAENGGLREGDRITPAGGLNARIVHGGSPAGTVHLWFVQRGAAHFTTQTRITPSPKNLLILIEIFGVVRLAMILIAIVVAVRRPELAAARALVAFLIAIALTLLPGGAWLPDPAFVVWRGLRGLIQIYAFSQGLRYACIFPFASQGGLRAWLARINPWYTAFTLAFFVWFTVAENTRDGIPDLGPLLQIAEYSPLGLFLAIFAAFAVAVVQSRGRDRQRVNWAAGSICVGFSGPLITTLATVFDPHVGSTVSFFPLTLIAIPIGLAYTILRHRTVDVGFVISRALVLTILSFVIIAAFGLLERALGKIFIDASHVASRSVEIALAIGLGFSLRSLHARIERIVDGIFFRTRRRALAALRGFAEDIYFITEADVAVQRTVEVAGRCSDAENAALYVLSGGVYGCAAALSAEFMPAEIGENDPLFVRLRAARQAQLIRDCGSDLGAEIAFPMFVRGSLVGALVLAPKRSGEAYDSEERTLLTEIAQRAGLALDALQTLALRRELDLLAAAR
jgi:hypothetical protein